MMQAHDRVSIEENQKSFACEICWRRFARETDLKTHVWIHTQSQEKGFSCDLCHRAFPCATTLNSHFKRTHKDVTLSPQPVVSSPLPISTPPPSQIQSQSIQQVRSPQQQQQLSVPSSQQLSIATSQELSISTSQQLPVSPDSATRKNSPPCGVCGKKFAFKYYVKIHQTVHTKEKPYICDLCHKTFSQASSRNRHRKEMHKEDSDVQQNGGGLQLGVSDSSENKVSQFDVLGKQYPSNRGALYEVHPVPDTKEKPYICDLCHKRFTQASSRNRHLKEMHKDGDTPLPPGESPPGTRRAVGVLTRNVGPSCQVCSKRFPCKSLLEIHMRVHTKERPYSCEICYKTFTQVSSRNFHRRKMHKDLILSLLPPQSQQQEQQEQQQQLALKQTTLVESGGKLVPECGVCGKRFPCKSLMEIHMRVHTKERPYSCDLCFKTFTQVSSRNFHRRKIHKEQIASPNSQTSSSSQSSLPQPLALGVCLPKAPSTPRLHQTPSSQLTDCHQKQLMQSTQLTQHQEQPNQLSQQQQNQLAHQQQSQLSQQQQSQLSQQQQSQLSQQQQSQLSQLQMQSQLAQQSQQQHQTQNPQLSQQLSQQQLNNQQNPMSPLTQQSQLQPCQLSHQQHRQSPLSPQRQSPPSQQPQLSPSPTITQQQANLHQHSRSHVLHQVQAETPSQTGQSLLVDSENKNFHCKMCASSSFNYK